MPARSATHSPVAANRNTTDSWKALTYSASAPKIAELEGVDVHGSVASDHRTCCTWRCARRDARLVERAPARRARAARRGRANVPTCSIAGGMSRASTSSAWTTSVIWRSTPVAARKLDPVRRAANTNAVGIATRTRLRASEGDEQAVPAVVARVPDGEAVAGRPAGQQHGAGEAGEAARRNEHGGRAAAAAARRSAARPGG